MTGKSVKEHTCTIFKNNLLTEVTYTEELPPSSGICKHISHLFRNLILASPYHNKAKTHLRSEAAIIQERKKHIEMKKYSFMIHPFSLFTILWQAFIFITWVIICFYIPYTTFIDNVEGTIIEKMVFFTDMLAIADIFVKLITGYHHEETKEIVMDLKESAAHYVKRLFIIDLVAALPVQVMVKPLHIKGLSDTLLLLKIFRLTCLRKYMVELFMQLNMDFKKQCRVGLFLRSLLFVQWTTSFYYQWSMTLHYIKGYFPPDMWILQNGLYDENTPPWNRYKTTIFFVIGFLTTSGNCNQQHDCSEEKFYMGVLMIAGYMFMTYLTITVYRLTLYTHAEKLQYHAKCEELQSFMRRKEIPEHLREKIFTYVNYTWEGHYFDEKEIMLTLSTHLQLEIKFYVCEKLLQSASFFKDFPRELIIEIMKKLQLNIYMAGEVILQSGSYSEAIYFLIEGSVVILTPNGKEVAHLKDGSFFGETCIIYPRQHNLQTIVALEFCEVYQMSLLDWHRCIRPYPAIKKELISQSKKKFEDGEKKNFENEREENEKDIYIS